MRYPAYQQFDRSRWPGTDAMPVGWEVRRLKFAATCNDETLPETTDPDYEIAYVDISSVDLVNGITTVEILSFEEAPSRARRIVRDGDTIVSTVRTYLKAIAAIQKPPDNMIISTGFAVVRPLDFIDNGFLGYALQSTGFIDAVVANSTGVSYPAINPSSLVCISVGYPQDKKEQRQIAAFLDWKTGQIDALIARKNELLEKLKEERIAVITRAVTQGLNPAAPMRDSGTPWLGQVPERWEVKRLKFVVGKIGSGKTPAGGAAVYVDSGVMLLRSQNIHDEGLQLDDVVFMTEEADELQSASRVQPRDVLLNITGASIGRVSVAPDTIPPTNVNQHVCIIRPDQAQVLPEYVHLLLCSKVAKDQIASTENGTSREGLTFPQVGDLAFPFPAIGEQREVFTYCEAELGKLKVLAIATQSAIDRLTEYRAALITAATTGKIDVRDVKLGSAA